RCSRSRKNRQRRVGEGPYMEGVGFGQPPFCNFVARDRKTAEILGFAAHPERSEPPDRVRITRHAGQRRAAPISETATAPARTTSPKPNVIEPWLTPRA